jgi:hypothetical protein
MASIIIGFSTPIKFNLFSFLIRTVCRSPMSHAYVKYYDEYAGMWVIFQASGLEVNYIGQDKFNTLENVIAEFEIPVSEELKLKAVQYSISKLGTPYGVKHIFGIGIVLLARLFGKKIKNPFADNGATMVCSELADDTLVVIDENVTLDPETAMPIDVYNFLVNIGATRK